MFVERNIFNVKMGHMDEFIAECKKVNFFKDKKITARVYTPLYAPSNVVAFEFEYESMAACEKINAEWVASKEYAEFMTKWVKLVERGGYIEAWERVF